MRPGYDGPVRKRLEASGIDRLALACGAATFAVHAALAGRYDLFRDELYFIACGRHPAFGYADQPPLVPLVAAALDATGLGVWAVRLPAALAAGALVWLAVHFTRLVGGRGAAPAVAALACAIAPMLMGLTATLNTSAFDPLAWTAIAFLLVRALRKGRHEDLLWAGLVAGLALEVKYALLFWLAGLAVGLLATPERRIFAARALYGGALLAALIAAPSVIWQAANGFPFLELGAAAEGKNADIALLPFLANQLKVMNPALAPLWIAGLVAPFASRRFADLRFIPIACAVVFAIVRLGHGKDYYLAPLYPTLFAIGAAALVPLLRQGIGRLALAVGLVAASALSALAAPLALPILPPAQLERYMQATGFAPQQQERSAAGTVLPQLFADQLGWRDFTAQVVTAWVRIPASERGGTAILGDNYGEAAALDYYGRRHGLPPALSGHNQYFLWGLRGQEPASLLAITHDASDLVPHCREVVVLGRTYSRFAVAHENGKAIALCSGMKRPLSELWPSLKRFE